MTKGVDTIQLKTKTSFPIVTEMLENIFNIKPTPLVKDKNPIGHNARGIKYVVNRSKISLNGFCRLNVTQYTTRDKDGYRNTLIEIYGLSQYARENGKHINTYENIKPQLDKIIQILNPILYRIDYAADLTWAFDEVALFFSHYKKPYLTTYYSHTKKSHANKQFCMYDKTAKNGLPNPVTRLELRRDYSRGRRPIILQSLNNLEEYLKEVEDITLIELTNNNVPTFIKFTQ